MRKIILLLLFNLIIANLILSKTRYVSGIYIGKFKFYHEADGRNQIVSEIIVFDTNCAFRIIWEGIPDGKYKYSGSE